MSGTYSMFPLQLRYVVILTTQPIRTPSAISPLVASLTAVWETS